MSDETVNSDDTNYLLAFIGGCLFLSGMLIVKYYLKEGFPEWLVWVLLIIGGLTLLVQTGWPFTSTFAIITFALITWLPGEDHIEVWNERIANSQVGDIYVINQYKLKGTEAPDDYILMFYKAIGSDNDSILFVESTKIYTVESFSRQLDDDSIFDKPTYPEEFSLSKNELKDLLSSEILLGVFRRD